jgi:hypothetical protein
LQRQINRADYALYEAEKQDLQWRAEGADALKTLDNHATSLEDERVQLLKRLNMVLLEVDRLSEEKCEMQNSLQEERLRSEELERRLTHTGKVLNVVDRNLQTDLKHERDENLKLKSLLQARESECTVLRGKMKDVDLSASQISGVNYDMSGKLQQKLDHLNMLENDRRNLLEKITVNKRQVGNYEAEHSALLQEKAKMKALLMQVDDDQREASMRVAEQQANYNELVEMVGAEKDKMVWFHRKHSRLLASHNIAQSLGGVRSRLLSQCLGALRLKLQFSCRRDRTCFKLEWVAFRHRNSRAKRALDQWRALLNWKDTHHSRVKAGELLFGFMKAKTAYKAWRKLYLYRKGLRMRQTAGLKNLFLLAESASVNMKHRSFATWKQLVEDLNGRCREMGQILENLGRSAKRQAVFKWRCRVLSTRILENQAELASAHARALAEQALVYEENLETLKLGLDEQFSSREHHLSSQLYKQNLKFEEDRALHAKDVQQSQVKTVLQRFNSSHQSQSFAKWKSEVREAKRCTLIDSLLAKHRRQEDSKWLRRVMEGWKAVYAQAKYRDHTGVLEVEQPVVDRLEAEIVATQQTSSQKEDLKLTRTIAKRMLSNLQSYFAQWKSAVPQFSRGTVLCKRMVVLSYKRKLRDAWKVWLTGAKDSGILELLVKNEAVTGDAEVLQEHVSILEQALAEKDDEKQELIVRRVRRATKLVANKLMTDCLRQWARNALNLSNCQLGGRQLEQFVRKQWCQGAFDTLLHNASALRTSDLYAQRLLDKQRKTSRQLLQACMAAWREHSASVDAVRRIMISSVNRALRSSLSRRFDDWKLTVERLKKLQDQGSEAEMWETRAQMTGVLTSKKKTLETAQASNSANAKGLNEQATSRLFNAVLRSQATSLGKLFHRWVDSAALRSAQLRNTRRLKQLWRKAKLRTGFRSWMVFRDLKERALATEAFNEKIRLKRETQRQLKSAKAELDAAHQSTDTTIQSAEDELAKTRERLQYMLTKAVNAAETQYSSHKLGYILSRWRERLVLDKQKLTDFVKVARRSVLGGAMLQIRLQASGQVAKLKDEALIRSNFKHYARRTLRGAFEKWRGNAHRLTLQQAAEVRLVAEKTQDQMQSMFDAVHQAGRQRAYKAVTGRTKHKILQGWAKLSKKLKAIEAATAQMVPTALSMRRIWAVSQWESWLSAKKVGRKKQLLAVGFSHKALMSRGFNGLREHHDITHFMGSVLGNTGVKLYHASLNSGFSAVKTYTAHNKTETDWSNFTITSRLKRLAGRLCQKLHVEAFYHWKSQVQLMEKSYVAKRRLMLRALHRKWRAGIRVWREGLVVQDAAYFAENEGDVAIVNSIKRGRLAVLEGILKKSGIDEDHLEKLLLEREDIDSTLTRKNLQRPNQAGFNRGNSPTLQGEGEEVIMTASPFSVTRGGARSPTRSPSRSPSKVGDRSGITTSPSKMTRASRKPLMSGNPRASGRPTSTPAPGRSSATPGRVSFEEQLESPRNFTEAANPLRSVEMSPSSSRVQEAGSRSGTRAGARSASPIKLIRVESSSGEDPVRLMARMLVKWKSTTAKRRRFRKAAQRMMAYRKNGSAIWAFLKWKHSCPLSGALTKGMSRNDLYKLLAKMDRDINNLGGLIEATSTKVSFLEGQSLHLEQNTRRSQNQALSALTLRCLNETGLAFLRWRLNANRLTVWELLTLMQGFEDKLYVLHDEYCHLEEENKALIGENVELRQASIDGIAIADAVEALSRERERLSSDLQSRAQTIKKLLEENSELTLRLRYIRDPERDVPRTDYSSK